MAGSRWKISIWSNVRFTLENKPENLEAGTLCASQYSFIIWFDETYEGN